MQQIKELKKIHINDIFQKWKAKINQKKLILKIAGVIIW